MGTAVAICSSLFLLGAVAGEGKIKIGVLTDLSGPAADIGKGSVASAQIAVEEFGGKLLGSVRHPFNVSDMSSFMLTAQASKAQVIALANSNNDTVNAIKAARDYGITPKQYPRAPIPLFSIT